MEQLVSVVVTTYNSEKEVERCLRSILNQTYKNIEIIISDDCSNDLTKSVVENVLHGFSKWKWINNQFNFGGPARGRNLGIKNALGDFICFCDADDEWHEDKLSKQVEYLLSNKLDFVGTNCSNIGAPDFKSFSGLLALHVQIRRNRVPLSSLCLLKKCFEKVNLFDESPDFRGVEDYDLILRLLNAKFKGAVMKERLVKYHFIQNSLSHSSRSTNEYRRTLVLNNLDMKSVTLTIYKKVITGLLRLRIAVWNLT